MTHPAQKLMPLTRSESIPAGECADAYPRDFQLSAIWMSAHRCELLFELRVTQDCQSVSVHHPERGTRHNMLPGNKYERWGYYTLNLVTTSIS